MNMSANPSTGSLLTSRPNPSISFDDRMETVHFDVSHTPHITVDSDVCRSCTTSACVYACPAKLFVPTADGGILFNYEQCFECGTCYLVCNEAGAINLVCNEAGAITWTYPEGGNGVVFRHG
jgi:ferredoxin like protein